MINQRVDVLAGGGGAAEPHLYFEPELAYNENGEGDC